MQKTIDIWPGDQVEVYRHLKKKWETGTVIRRYGIPSHKTGPVFFDHYPDVVDVRFGDDNISRGHFTSSVEKI